jgi:DNA-binding response OmpR family regulator
MTQARILLADDDSGLRALMARRLNRLECELHQAENGKEALALLEDNDYDLIVSDIYMPGATGLDILRAAREKDPRLQVVVVTAAATLENAIEALNNGAFGYMIKPFDHISVFDNTVRRALEYRRVMRENQRMAEAQKRRGDMLQDEVTDRIQQYQIKQRQLMEILSNIPDGLLVLDEQGRLTLSNPEAEKLLAQESKLDHQPLQEFIDGSRDSYADEKIRFSLGEDQYQCARYDLPGSEEHPRQLIMIQPVLKTSSLPAGELWQPLEKALEIAEWLREQSHSGRQEAALERMSGELTVMAALLMELNPQLNESPRGIERNQLEIPPEIEAKMKVDEPITPTAPERSASGSEPNAQVRHSTDQKPKAPRSSLESEPRLEDQTPDPSS